MLVFPTIRLQILCGIAHTHSRMPVFPVSFSHVQRLTNCSAREFELQQERDALLLLQPFLREQRDDGYIKLGESQYVFDQASRFIVEHEYQKTFFNRTYADTAPSPLDGKILEAVGNIKDRDYSETWGEKGIGRCAFSDGRVQEPD